MTNDARSLTSVAEKLRSSTFGPARSRRARKRRPRVRRSRKSEPPARTSCGCWTPGSPIPFEAYIYPPEVQTAMRGIDESLHGGWQAAMQSFTDSLERVAEGTEARERFDPLASAFIDATERVARAANDNVSRIFDARRNLARSFLALFALLSAVGILSAFAYSLTTLLGMRRDFTRLISFGRRISEGDFSASPGISRNDEIGELAAQLRNMSSLESSVVGPPFAGGQARQGMRPACGRNCGCRCVGEQPDADHGRNQRRVRGDRELGAQSGAKRVRGPRGGAGGRPRRGEVPGKDHARHGGDPCPGGADRAHRGSRVADR